MARSRRRPTIWRGRTYGSNELTLAENAVSGSEIIGFDYAELREQGGTVIRLLVDLHLNVDPGGIEAGGDQTIVNCWAGIMVAPVSQDPINPNDEPGYESWMAFGYMRNRWLEVANPVENVSGVIEYPTRIEPFGPEHQRWQGDFRSMRKIRDGDSLMLYAYAELAQGNPDAINLTGYVKALIKTEGGA